MQNNVWHSMQKLMNKDSSLAGYLRPLFNGLQPCFGTKLDSTLVPSICYGHYPTQTSKYVSKTAIKMAVYILYPHNTGKAISYSTTSVHTWSRWASLSAFFAETSWLSLRVGVSSCRNGPKVLSCNKGCENITSPELSTEREREREFTQG